MRISSAFCSPRQRGGGEAVADLHALHGIDGHQRGGDIGVELAVDRRAQPGGTPSATTSITAPSRRAGLADLSEVGLPAAAAVAASGQKNGLLSTSAQSQRRGRSGAGPSAPARRGCARPRPAPCGRRRRRRRASPSRAPRTGRRRDSRGCRISAHRSGRHGRAGTASAISP